MENSKICQTTSQPCKQHKLQCNTTCLVDLEAIKQSYVNEIGEHVNLSGESGDFTAKLMYEIFDWFKPHLKVEEKEVDNWISVEDRKPIATKSGNWDGLKSESILVLTKESFHYEAVMYYGTLDGSYFCQFYSISDWEIDNVTHWQPLPKKT
jgi:hypothetical protein